MLKKFTVWFCLLFSSGLLAQVPVAQFTADVTKGCSPLVVQFTNQSTGSGNSYLWDLGNGNTSTLTNPAASYITPGTYTVKLTATNSIGNNTATKVAYITVFSNPVVAISAAPAGGCSPLVVQFMDKSTSASAPINKWVWDFGDGQTSTSKNLKQSRSSSLSLITHLFSS